MIFLMSVGLVNLIAGIKQAIRLFRQRYRETTGFLHTARVALSEDIDYGGNTLPVYQAEVLYSFDIGGVTYQGEQLSLLRARSSKVSEIKKQLVGLREQAHVTVYYVEGNPKESYLRNPSKWGPLSLIFGGGIFLVCLAFSIILWHVVE